MNINRLFRNQKKRFHYKNNDVDYMIYKVDTENKNIVDVGVPTLAQQQPKTITKDEKGVCHKNGNKVALEIYQVKMILF